MKSEGQLDKIEHDWYCLDCWDDFNSQQTPNEEVHPIQKPSPTQRVISRRTRKHRKMTHIKPMSFEETQKQFRVRSVPQSNGSCIRYSEWSRRIARAIVLQCIYDSEHSFE